MITSNRLSVRQLDPAMNPLPRYVRILTIALAMLLSGNGFAASHDDQVVNLYSLRQPFLIAPMLAAFTEATGIKVNVVYAKQGILERIKAEGRNTAADAVLSVDIGRLNAMVAAGVLQGIQSDAIDANIPPQYRHPDGLWFGLTTRARVFFVSKDRVGEDEFLTYESLAEPYAKGRICIRSGKNVYNVSLIAAMIAHHGEAWTRDWLKNVKANLARRPQGNDRAQAKAIYEGVCDVGVANTYYYGKMQTNEKKPEQKQWADAIRIVFPNHDGRGTHVNVSGIGVTQYAKNRGNAIRLIEFLSGAQAQRRYAADNFEYPVKPGVASDARVRSWGRLNPDAVDLAYVATLRTAASKLVDEVRFDR